MQLKMIELPAACLTWSFCPFEWQNSPALPTATPIASLSVDENSVLLLLANPILYVPGFDFLNLRRGIMRGSAGFSAAHYKRR